MRVRSACPLVEIDVDFLNSAVQAVHDEWRNLRFDVSGQMVDPVARIGDPLLRLTEGSHGRESAEYLLTIEIAKHKLPDDLEAEKSAELNRLFAAGDKVDTDDLIATTAKYSSQKVRTETRLLSMTLVVVEQALRRVGIIASQQKEWSAKVVVDHQRASKGSIDFRSDVISLARLAGEKVHGCLRWPVAGPAEIYAQIDLAALVADAGSLVEIEGRLNRFRFSISSEVEGRRGDASISSTMTLTGKGLGRLVLILGRHWLKPALQNSFDGIHSEEGMARFADELQSMRIEVGEAGALAANLHKEIWDIVAKIREDRSYGLDSPPA